MVISKKLPGGYIKTVFTVIVALYITAVAVYLI